MLANLEEGIVDPVFVPVIEALNALPLEHFSLLDAACATGYYSEVVQSQVPKPVQYRGCDFSSAMIEQARRYYPDLQFDVEDLTGLTYPDRGFDVVLLSGALEHIPGFEDAVSEACRVCSSYLILHRCPLTSGSEHEYTAGSQYNIETSRIYFSRRPLINGFAQHGLALDREVNRSILRGPAEAPVRTVVTFVFKRE
jgi:SAM-dependent methyltransferase